jgi:hypothetical protein
MKVGAMKKNLLSFCLLTILVAGCGEKKQEELKPIPLPPPVEESGPPLVVVTATPEEAAKSGLDLLKSNIRIDTAKASDGSPIFLSRVGMTGISDTNEGKLASVGKPFLKLLLKCKPERNAEGLKPLPLRDQAVRTTWIYPVLVNDQIRSQLFVDSIPEKGKQKAGFYTSAFGDTGVVKSFGRVIASLKLKPNDSIPTGLLVIAGMNQFFVYRGLNEKAQLLPLPGFSIKGLFSREKPSPKNGFQSWQKALSILDKLGLEKACDDSGKMDRSLPKDYSEKPGTPDSTIQDTASPSPTRKSAQ